MALGLLNINEGIFRRGFTVAAAIAAARRRFYGKGFQLLPDYSANVNGGKQNYYCDDYVLNVHKIYPKPKNFPP